MRFSVIVLVILLLGQTAGQFNFGNFGNILGNFAKLGGGTNNAMPAPAAGGTTGGGFGNLLGNLFGGVQNIGNAVQGVANGVNQIKGGVNAVQNIVKNPTGGATGLMGLNNVLGNLGMLGNIANMFQGGLGAIGNIGGLLNMGGTTTPGAPAAPSAPSAPSSPGAPGPGGSPGAPASPGANAGAANIGGVLGNIPNIFGAFTGTAAANGNAAGGNPFGNFFGGLIGQGGLFGGLLNGNAAPGANPGANPGGAPSAPSAPSPGGAPNAPSSPGAPAPGPGAQTPGGPSNQQFGLPNWFQPFAFGGAFGPKNQPTNFFGFGQNGANGANGTQGGPAPAPYAPSPGGMQKAATALPGVGTSCRGGVSGTCRDTRTFRCGLAFRSGLCAGPAQVKCCPSGSSSGVTMNQNVNVPPISMPSGRRCSLVRPSGCSSFQGKTVTVNSDFADEVIRLDAHARNAGIKLYITDSFRASTAGYGAARSRHKAGFAIDLNANGCNAACMCGGTSISNSGARNFVTAVMADSTLHWGGDPRRPIPWSVGGCSRDSVHFESTNYQAGSNYDTIVPCLNTAFRAGQFSSFSCGSGIGLLNEDVKKSEEAEQQEGLSAGAIAAIVIFSVLVVIALVVVAGCLIQRRRSAQSIDMPNAMFTNDASNMASAVYDRSGTVSAGSAGSFVCNVCNKTYNYEADLLEHKSVRGHNDKQ